MVNNYIGLFIILIFALFIPFNANSQGPQQVCEVIQITSSDLDSNNPTVCGNGTGILFTSRADLLNNGHPDQQDLFFADITDPFNPIFFQLTNTPQGKSRLSISDDCTVINFSSRSDFVGMNPSNFDQLFSADISDLNNPTFTQLTNTAANNASTSGSTSGDGTKIALESSEDITGMNPDGTKEFFIFDFNNAVVPFEQLTNDPSATGSIISTPIINANGSAVAFISSENYIPPNNNANGGRELYLSTIAYSPPMAPLHTLFQITNFPNNSFRAQGPAFNSAGNRILFGSNANITGMNVDGNTDLFVVDVNDPSNPFFTQITKSPEFTASSGIIDAPGILVAFITDNQDFVCRRGGGDGIILANITDVNNPVFTPLTNFRPGTDLDDLSSPDEFTFIAFESDSDLIGGNNVDESDEIYIIFPQNCSCFVAAIPSLSEWGLIAMAGLLGIIGLLAVRKRMVTA